MSQSDYIQFIRTADVLKNQTKLPPVLTSNEYTDYESYALETTIPNTKHSFSRLLPTNSRTIFDMEKKVSLCPTFQLCSNTNQRPNRRPLPNSIIFPTYRITKTGVRYPAPTNRTSKSYTPPTCTYIDGNVTRTVACNKNYCKCRTRVLTPNPLPKNWPKYSRTNPPPAPV
jgi:hypothetical protein